MPERFPIQLRWTDIDANRHVKHSSYYDFGAIVRMQVLTRSGVDVSHFEKHRIGIVLFREECIFRREIVFEDTIEMDVVMTKATANYSRWSLKHHLFKNGDTLAAEIAVDGAWIDLERRKLTAPDPLAQKVFGMFEKSGDFQEIVPGVKK